MEMIKRLKIYKLIKENHKDLSLSKLLKYVWESIVSLKPSQRKNGSRNITGICYISTSSVSKKHRSVYLKDNFHHMQ